MYGATEVDDRDTIKTFFVPGKRRRLNWVGLAFSYVLAPMFFIFVITLLSSEYRFHHPKRAYIYSMFAVVVALMEGVYARSFRVRDREPMWLGFIFLSIMVAIVCGTIAGNYNFNQYMQPYYDITSLNEYPNINVGLDRGDTYLDAGFLGFSDGTELELNMPGAYRHGEMYCAVPIVNRNVDSGVPKTGTYDYWAVGKNCCGDPVGVFRCGDWHNPASRSGLREINLEDRPNYLLAVEQATVKYSIHSDYPILVRWVQNPLDIALEYKVRGNEMWTICVGAYFVINSVFCFIAMLFFSRIGQVAWKDEAKHQTEAGVFFDVD